MPSTPSNKYQCPSCGKRYDRLDHLNRHLSSHKNSRSFRCNVCQKGYNRADLLHRHKLAHRRPPMEPQKRVERAAQACKACIIAKTKCSDEKPCKRCKLRAQDCEVPAPTIRNVNPESSTTFNIGNSSPDGGLVNSGQGSCAPIDPEEGGEPIARQVTASEYQSPNGSLSLGSTQQSNESDIGPFPAFFDHILQPCGTYNQGLVTPRACTPPDVSNFLQDINFDFSDLDYPAIDLAMFGDAFPTGRPYINDQEHTANTAQRMPSAMRGTPRLHPHIDGPRLNNQAMTTPESREQAQAPTAAGPSDIISRSDAFRRSPWAFWRPGKHQHAFTGQEEINVNEESLSTVDSPLTNISESRNFRDNLDHDTRDQILALVLKTSITRFSVPSFPSLDLLNNLLRAFFTQEDEAIAKFIHSRTFTCHTARPELLLALVAAGATAIPVHHIQQMGHVIQEVIRLAIGEIFERDNSTIQNLQTLQADLICLQLGSWSGIKRKVIIACAFMQPLHGMLHQAGRLGRAYYAGSNVRYEDEPINLEEEWREWVEMESLKRLVIRTFIQDSQVSMAFLLPPVMSYAHLTLPVPEAADSWLAADAEAWRWSKSASTDKLSHLSLIEVFSDLTILDEHYSYADIQLCCFAAIHALANRAWELRQQTVLLSNHRGQKPKELESLYDNLRQNLYNDLIAARAYCERRVPHREISFVVEYIMMSLHVSLEDVQSFAGKNGEGEARRAVPALKEWIRDSCSRTAIWHAGQVFRMARCFPPSALRSFYVIGVYHAALTLWVYSLLRSSSDRQNGIRTPNISRQSNTREINSAILSSGIPAPRLVRLDRAENLEVRAFVLQDQGVPGLSHPLPPGSSSYVPNIEQEVETALPFTSLSKPALVMEVAIEILRRNLPYPGEPAHLVQNLVSLMADLGSLPVS